MKKRLFCLFTALCTLMGAQSALAQDPDQDPNLRSTIAPVAIDEGSVAEYPNDNADESAVDETASAPIREADGSVAIMPRNAATSGETYVQNTNDVSDDLPITNETQKRWRNGWMLDANVGVDVGTVFVLIASASFGGFNLAADIGYHWQHFGIFVEQKLLGMWLFDVDTAFTEDDDKEEYNIFGGLMGMTSLLLKFYIPIRDSAVFMLGGGAGVFYTKAEDDEVGVGAILRLSAGCSFFVTDDLSLGFKADFAFLHIFIFDFEPSFTISYQF